MNVTAKDSAFIQSKTFILCRWLQPTGMITS